MSTAGPPTRSLLVVAALASVALAAPAIGQVEAVPREPEAEQSVRWGPLVFHYQLEPGPPDRIRLAARVSNGGPRPVEVDVPWCLAWLRLHQERREVWDRGGWESCEGMTRLISLAPGESVTDRYTLLLDSAGPPLRPGSPVRVSAFLPGHRLPWMPPRAAADVTLTHLSVVVPGGSRRRFVRTLGLPNLPWGSSGSVVSKRFLREGFREAGSDPNGSLLFNGHDFLGRNAGLIARVHDGRLVKIVALMEPNDGRELRSEFRAVRKRLVGIYGPPASSREGPGLRALWRQTSPAGVHQAELRATDDGLLRLDLEPPVWRRLHGDGVRAADAGGRSHRQDVP